MSKFALWSASHRARRALLAAGTLGATGGAGNRGAGVRCNVGFGQLVDVKSATAGGGMTALVAAAKEEGTLNVIALPTNWANYGDEIEHVREEVRDQGQQRQSERHERPGDPGAQEDAGRQSAPDVVDVGASRVHRRQRRTCSRHTRSRPGRTSRRNKAANGSWYNDYGGYISFGCDLNRRQDLPDDLDGAEVPVQERRRAERQPVSANAALSAVWAAALNNGGSLSNIEPGMTSSSSSKSDGTSTRPTATRPSVIAALVPDPDQLGLPEQRQGLGPARQHAKWKVVDPTGTSFAGYYVQAISKYAPHPAAARLWEEFLYSTQGQNIWLRVAPARSSSPAMVKDSTENKTAYKALPAVANLSRRRSRRSLRRRRRARTSPTTGRRRSQHRRSIRCNDGSRGASAPRDRRSRGPAGGWVGILPFAVYVLVFLGLPLYVVIHGALTTDGASSRWTTSRRLHLRVLARAQEQPDPVALDRSRRRLLRHLAGGGGRRGKPGGMLRRIVSSASGVLAYFAGVPLAFAFIATLGRVGVLTVLLKHIGIDLNADGFTISSMIGVGLATSTSRSR